ncbi:efflux RND transporter periplasmic adaptor subunit [Pluralibacter gergoviae]|uniref:Efflux RND transporter periplasmic adaptor subunit n=2 Tax=Pluralibacter gergoviae TaxID=61647 RepID=A0AAI9DP59_PLUGE|nr:efflux RND transporter periplasmic adaptor subunit [Pluralibacter gergoviae]EKV9909497.1 efflux RND transporter periplasmic adaptor subunit [Pluralibacter gergoviae]EKW7277083.1 efflux RND transporter periplasmic adaptor subunit [Pluralibacter gergoviae]ELD4297857.1 efflux RND transporter periplasmic adaptor subunit [Pluralibacter gergoviae]ELD4308602.1 efflux RND transporter periplasmic adaptor subunit [Pluralibacter gergoviae]
MRKKKLLLIIAVLLVAGCDNSNKTVAKNDAPVHVDVTTLRSQNVTLSTQLPGRTASVRTAEVRPQVDGIILKRQFKEGAEVKAGQPLYQIDPATYQAAVNKAQAAWRNATILEKRFRTLSGVEAISKQDYDDALTNAQETKAALDTANINLEYTKVRAPISGRIDRSLVTEGALVTNGQANYLTTITQLDPIYVDISESSRNLLSLRKMIESGKLRKVSDHEAAVRLVLEDGTPYPNEGRLEFAEVRIDETTGSVILRATFPNKDRILLPGMFVHAQLVQGVQENGILVPQQSIGRDNKGHPYVYVVDNDSVVHQRAIATGEMINGQWLVTQGLKEGEKVVTAGLQQVRDGAKVQWQEQDIQNTKDANSSLTIADPSAQ